MSPSPSYSASQAGIFLNNGTASFTLGLHEALPHVGTSVACGDLDGDGAVYLDFLAGAPGSADVVIFLNAP